jgi:hypothetical protein
MDNNNETSGSQHHMPSPVDVAVRLADEGIPVLAIARATKLPSTDIYQALRTAVAQGFILEMPRDDWPPGSKRADRLALAGTPLENEEDLKCACTRYFKTSPLEAAMLGLMLKRDEVTKVQLHAVIEANRPPGKEITEIKMVDVMICKLRKKLAVHAVSIATMWGVGYFISRADREKAIKVLLDLQEK